MNRVISFCLWGDKPVYTRGACRNAELAAEIYPGWICRFYIAGRTTPASVIDELRSYPNSDVVVRDTEGSAKSMMWRFEPADDRNVELFISRDTDCRLSGREKEAVDEWVESDRIFHIMRDHPYHKAYMLGGMWGMKNGHLKRMRRMIDTYLRDSGREDVKGLDQYFLKDCIWPLAQQSYISHDPFFEKHPFPTSTRDPNATVYYVGECVHADDSIWSQKDRDELRRAEAAAS